MVRLKNEIKQWKKKMLYHININKQSIRNIIILKYHFGNLQSSFKFTP